MLGLSGGVETGSEAFVPVGLTLLLVFAASVFGLAWLAYKRPAAFVERVCPQLALLFSGLLVLGVAWNVSLTVSGDTLLWHAASASWIHSDMLRDGGQLPYELLLVLFGGGAAYFFFLHRLLRRFAAEYEPPSLTQPPQGSAVARRTYFHTGDWSADNVATAPLAKSAARRRAYQKRSMPPAAERAQRKCEKNNPSRVASVARVRKVGDARGTRSRRGDCIIPRRRQFRSGGLRPAQRPRSGSQSRSATAGPPPSAAGFRRRRVRESAHCKKPPGLANGRHVEL